MGVRVPRPGDGGRALRGGQGQQQLALAQVHLRAARAWRGGLLGASLTPGAACVSGTAGGPPLSRHWTAAARVGVPGGGACVAAQRSRAGLEAASPSRKCTCMGMGVGSPQGWGHNDATTTHTPAHYTPRRATPARTCSRVCLQACATHWSRNTHPAVQGPHEPRAHTCRASSCVCRLPGAFSLRLATSLAASSRGSGTAASLAPKGSGSAS